MNLWCACVFKMTIQLHGQTPVFRSALQKEAELYSRRQEKLETEIPVISSLQQKTFAGEGDQTCFCEWEFRAIESVSIREGITLSPCRSILRERPTSGTLLLGPILFAQNSVFLGVAWSFTETRQKEWFFGDGASGLA